MRFNPAEIAMINALPQHVSADDAWHEHVPFTFALIEALKPEIVVELGMQPSDFYWTACQAISALQLSSRFYFVGTVGRNDESEDLNKLRHMYKSFSRVISLEHDKAIDMFADRSINVLSISGARTYDDVRGELEIWMEKVSDKGVVLLPGISIRNEDFDLWRVWDEVSTRHPSCSFVHGHGLGVLAGGAEVPEQLSWLFDAEERDRVARYFAGAGKRVAELAEAAQDRQAIRRMDAVAPAGLETDKSLQVLPNVRLGAVRSAEVSRLESELQSTKTALATANVLLARVESSAVWRLGERWIWLRQRYLDHVPGLRSLLNALHALVLRNRRSDDPVPVAAASVASRQDVVIEFEAVSDPEVSIIVPCYNNPEEAYTCASYVLANTPSPQYEVILVDDASPKRVDEYLRTRIRNATIVRNEANLGYIKTCNKASEIARGKCLVFLNQDTQPQFNWLEPLAALTRNRDDVGMVGAKLLYPDGRMQEAGAIIWNDMTAWNFGRGDDPEKSEYNYVREVDYCSGACVLIPANVFSALGGFDEALAPAYGDDADFGMKLRRAGYKVLFQPKAQVVHAEGTSMGTDVTQGLKRYQEINRYKLAGKWGSEVAVQKPNGKDVFVARERHCGPTLLFIDHYVPTWDKDAGSLRMYEYIKIFVDLGVKVVFWPANLYRTEPYTSELQQMGVEVMYGQRDFAQYIAENSRFIDVVYGCRSWILKDYIDVLHKHDMKVIYDPHDLSYIREARRAEVEDDKAALREANRLRRLEHYVIERSAGVVLLSSFEESVLQKEFSEKPLFLHGTIHPLHASRIGFSERNGLLFLGGFAHKPNVDAIKWFVTEIFPELRRMLPGITVDVVGSEMPREVFSLGADDIRMVGYVADLAPYFERNRLFVAPLRYGAGQKGKIAQSLAHGLPVVTTSVGAEGMALTSGVDVLVADDPQEFAQAVVKAYEDEELWRRLAERGFQFAKEHHSPEYMKGKLQEMLKAVGVWRDE